MLNLVFTPKSYIYIYIYIKIILWCEDEERSIPLQVERKVKVNTQGKDQLLLATQSFTPVGDLQATDISNLLQAHKNKGDM